MKREVILTVVFISFMFVSPMIFADETSQINSAYSCLNDKINSSGCSQMSFEEKTFSLLAVGKCYNEIANQNSSNQCWPSGSCTIKDTSRAILALSEYNSDYNISSAKSWLLSNTAIPGDLNWFLEIDTDEASTCTIYYPGNENGVILNVADDKKLSSTGLGSCLTLAYNNYLVQVSPTCYNMEIDISCNKGFITTLLFKKEDSSTFNVLYNIQSAAASGTLTEKVSSLCFTSPSSDNCDYEGSLWASQVLHYYDENVSEFLPYLIAFSEDNSEYIPESFLYYLTGEFRNELLFKQKAGKYWFESTNRFYDTALALLPLQSESPTQKVNSKNWLLEVQGEDGCWNNGNLRDTAFLLYSIWPRNFNGEDEEGVCGDSIIDSGEECDGSNLNGKDCEDLNYASGTLSCYSSTHTFGCEFNKTKCVLPDCEEDNDCPNDYICSSAGECVKDTTDPECEYDSDCSTNEECLKGVCVEASLDCKEEGYFCMPSIDCEGNLLSNYDCTGLSKCCSKDNSFGTCFSQGGEICSSDETCKNDNIVEADNTLSGEVCCLSVCEEDNNVEEYTCEANNGNCKTSCSGDETESPYYSCSSSNICCFKESAKKNTLIIWILLGLILVIVLAIVFREKIKELLMRAKHKKRPTGSPAPMFGGFRPSPPSTPVMRPVQRRIIPPQQRSPPKLPPKSAGRKNSKELDEVLEKLRKIGK